ncbi:MAG: ABC transporter permease [Ruminococcus sp.]|nr:ABC transporter permease [Ruminococcus sp.]
MRVFLRYITKNMLEKKGRFFLLIFSIMVSTALLVFSLGAVDVILDGYTDTIKQAADGKDISIYSNTDDVFFSEDDFDHTGISGLEGHLRMIGVINEDDKISYIYLIGNKDCSKYVVEGKAPEDTNEPLCVISQRVAEERNLKVGDKFSVFVNGEAVEFSVSALAAPKGTYYGDTKESFNVILPYEYMNEMMQAGGRYNYMYANTDRNAVKFCDNFNDNNTRVKASSLSDLSAYKSMTSSMETTVYVMFAIVCVICCIIIHGAFKLIITERLTVIGTFMSQGATKKKIQNILLTESFLYGLVGGIIGTILGEAILYYVSRLTSPLADYGIYMAFHITPRLIIVGIIFSILMCVLSALMPVRRIRKLPVKDVILNRLETKHKSGEIRFVVGIGLLIFSIFAAFATGKWTIDASFLIGAAALVGMIMLLRKFLKYASGWLSSVFRKKTSIFLALNNIKTSKLLRGNITLLVISFSSVLLIASVGTSLTNVVEDAYRDLQYDYQIYNIIDNNAAGRTTDTIIEKLSSLDCVDNDSILPQYNAQALIKKEIVFIEAADPVKYSEYNLYLRLNKGKQKDYINELANSGDDTVIISTYVSKISGKDIGDEIEFNVDGEDYKFKVVGTFNGRLYNNGRVILMKPETILNKLHIKEASSITFNISNKPDNNKELDAAMKNAEDQFKGFLANLGASYISRDDAMEENVEGNKQLVMILSIFAYLALIVASIGIFNNISISFQQRRREFAVMASVGLNGKMRKRLVFTENIFCVFWSIAISIPYTLLMCRICTKIMEKIDLPFGITFDPTAIISYSIVLIAVIFIASLSTMRKSKKLNVVQELKYE